MEMGGNLIVGTGKRLAGGIKEVVKLGQYDGMGLTSIKLSYTTVLSYQSSFRSGNHQNDISSDGSNIQIDIHIPYSDSDSDSRDWG